MTVHDPLTFAACSAALAVATILYYSWRGSVLILRRAIHAVSEPLRRRFPVRHVDAICSLAYAGILQACFFVIIALVFDPAALRPQTLFACDPVLALLGIVLGIGEMGLSTLLGFAAIVTIDAALGRLNRRATTISRQPASAETTDWSVTARGGWMQYYLKAMAILPKPLGVAFVLLYVFFEEGVFRGVILGSLSPFGQVPALAVSVVLFMVAQVFHTPGWRTAMFPVIGALVLGTINGALFLVVPKLLPLVLAHASFFFSALWSIPKSNPGTGLRSLG